MKTNKALFLDLDGTVRGTRNGRHCPSRPDEQFILPRRKELIQKYKGEGYKVVAVTNQGGIGLGLMTEKQCKDCLEDLDKRLGGVFDKMLFSKGSPSSNDPYRKPRPGMILDAAKDLKVNLKNSIMVGDMETDKQAAEEAGVSFKWAKDFFDD